MSRTNKALLMLGIILVVLAFLWLRSCQEARTSKNATKVAKGQGEAAIDAGAEATNTITAIIANDATVDTAVEGGINEIRNATEADRGLAAQRAACRLPAYQHSERCAALRAAGPGNASQPR